MSSLIRLVVLQALLSVVAVDAHAAAVAVLPLAGRQPAAERAAITTALREELARVDVDVLGGPDTDRVIQSASALGGTCAVTTAACALQLGGLAGVTTVVVGAVDGGQLTLRALDVASEREVGRVTLPIQTAAPRPTLRLAAIRLLRPEREVGQLVLFVDVAGAIVSIDGAVVGRTPLDVRPLRPGAHDVVVSHPDHDTQTFTAQIAMGETTTLHVEMAGKGASSSPSVEATGGDDFRQIVLLDVTASGRVRDERDHLMAALTTLALVDELQRRERVIVVSPADLDRAPGGPIAVNGCVDDDCLRRVLGARFNGDVIVAGLVIEDDGATLVGRRLQLASGRLVGPISRRVLLSTPAHRQRLAGAAATLVDDLYDDLQLRPDLQPDLTIRERFAPPPVPLAAFIGTVSGLAAGVAVTGVSAAGFVGASADNDPAANLWGAGIVVGGVVTAVGLAASIIESPFVDWSGHGAANATLLDEVAARHSRR